MQAGDKCFDYNIKPEMELLSDNAIVHISAGFEGPFILQAFSVKRDLYRRATYNFCLTDG